LKKPPLKDDLDTLAQLISQDLEPDPGGGGMKIREGVAPDRRVSVEDREMRHGRKSKSKRFNGYKRHIATDLDSDLILARAITPANRPEEEAAPELQRDIEQMGRSIAELNIDWERSSKSAGIRSRRSRRYAGTTAPSPRRCSDRRRGRHDLDRRASRPCGFPMARGCLALEARGHLERTVAMNRDLIWSGSNALAVCGGRRRPGVPDACP
jgi:hypothetical protein